MKRSFSIAMALVLGGIWLMLWGEVTVANLVSAVAVVALVVVIVPDAGRGVVTPTVRPWWALRFVAKVVSSLLMANLVVARETMSRGSSINTGIIAVPMDHCSDGLLTLVANVLGLAPGTMPIETTRTPPVVYVHILHLDDVEAVRAEIIHLADLAVRAFGSADAVASLP